MTENDAQLITFEPDMARLNITWNAQNGDLGDPVPYNLDDPTIKNLAAEAVRGGSVPGISAGENPNFTDFVVDRFPPTDTLNFHRLSLRPKTPFGR